MFLSVFSGRHALGLAAPAGASPLRMGLGALCVSPVSTRMTLSTAAPVEEEDRPRSFLETTLVKVAKWYRKSMGYHKYGLRKEDILIENADITEALSRLPKQERLDREFRFKRAFDASGHNDFLPKRAWLTQEEADKPYLKEALEEVLEEKRERAEYKRS